MNMQQSETHYTHESNGYRMTVRPVVDGSSISYTATLVNLATGETQVNEGWSSRMVAVEVVRDMRREAMRQ